MSTVNAARDELETHWDELRELAAGEGTLEVIVVRPAVGERVTPATGELSLEDGLVGDRWRASARTLQPCRFNSVAAEWPTMPLPPAMRATRRVSLVVIT